jgi:LysR family glycine cleavage system transcriptional activator
MRKLPPLGSLRAFEAAARRLSFQEAATELTVTPTAISHQIKLLEQYCGQALFQRRPRPVEMSEAGAVLYPAVRDGLDAIAEAILAIQQTKAQSVLRLTTTNAFASKWLIPRLAEWRRAQPDIVLEVIGTDAVLDLRKSEADLAIRYMPAPPADFVSHQLFRDTFVAVCHPDLLPSGEPLRALSDLSGHTLIHCHWTSSNPTAPTWRRFLQAAEEHYKETLNLKKAEHLHFQEELHAIDAASNGQGIVVISDILVARELADEILVKALGFSLPGYGFYLTFMQDHLHESMIEAFVSWAEQAP